MSKIFDALQGGGSEAADVMSALLDNGAPQPKPAPQPKAAPQPAEAQAKIVVPPLPPAEPPQAWRPRVVSLAVPASAPLLPFEKAGMPAAEQYRIARTKITHHPKRPKVIVVTSPSVGDGKSISAINLAAALGLQSEIKVLLIDGDFRRSSIHPLLGLAAVPGLAEVISGEQPFEDVVVQAEQYPNLHILVSGSSTINPAELLDSQRWRALCDRLRERYQYVIIDSPPISMVADFELIQLAADGTILVMRPDHTKRNPALKALETVPREKLVGVLLNCVGHWILYKHEGYGYGYAKAYATQAASKVERENGDRPQR